LQQQQQLVRAAGAPNPARMAFEPVNEVGVVLVTLAKQPDLKFDRSQMVCIPRAFDVIS
jgi:hypothetical protein